MAKISIIIPVFNKEDYIERAIKSVLQQTFTDYELIIIDDGSEDNSAEIIRKIRKNNKNIKYFYQENQGVSVARNQGILKAKGKYISFLDADDTWEPEFLTEMYSNIKLSKICYCGHYIINKEFKKKARIKFTKGDIYINYLKNITTPHTNSWLIDKEYLIKNNIYFTKNLNWGEDHVFFSKVLIHETNVKYVNKFLTNYHIDIEDSLSKENINKIEKDIEWVKLLLVYIDKKVVNVKRKKLAKEILLTYRLPGAIIYRLYNYRSLLSKDKMMQLYRKYQESINGITMSNGIRSIKLMYYKYKLLSYLYR